MKLCTPQRHTFVPFMMSGNRVELQIRRAKLPKKSPERPKPKPKPVPKPEEPDIGGTQWRNKESVSQPV